MSSRDTNLKEKFRIALNSTAKVISDDFDLNKKNIEDKKTKDIISLEIDNLTNPSDFIRLRAETDSRALKKKFSDELIYKKNLPNNNSSRSLYNIAEKIRYCIDFKEFLIKKCCFLQFFTKKMLKKRRH